jgi:hypothetical protein
MDPSEWVPVSGSSRVVAERYDGMSERIYVRFPDGMEWWYGACTPQTWAEFTSQSRGKYIAEVLNHKPNGRAV